MSRSIALESPTALRLKGALEIDDLPSASAAASTLTIHTTTIAIKTLSTNLAWEILCLGLKKERQYQIQLHRYADEGADLQSLIRKLIDFNSKLTIQDKPSVLSDEAIALAQEIEKSGIKLLEKGEKKVSPERMAAIKAEIGSHSDRLKTELQNKFTTKIQVTINEVNSLMETLRMSMKYNDRLMEIIIGNQRKQ
jgi:hypothetical protein